MPSTPEKAKAKPRRYGGKRKKVDQLGNQDARSDGRYSRRDMRAKA